MPLIGTMATVIGDCILRSVPRWRLELTTDTNESMTARRGDVVTFVEIGVEEYDSGGRWVKVLSPSGVGWVFTDRLAPLFPVG